MLSQERQSTQSPVTSVQSGSVRTAPVTNSLGRRSVASSISEEERSSRIPTPPPLPKKVTPSRSVSQSSEDTVTPPKKNPVIQRPIYQSSPMDDTDKSELSDASTTQKKPATKYPTISKLVKDVSLDKGKTRSPDIPISVSKYLSNGNKNNQSVFEKVDLHNGRVSYLGTGNFSNLEDCIRECLAKDQYHRGRSYANLHHNQHHSTLKSLTRASVLEDYSYDGVLSPNHQRYSYHHYLNDDHHHHHHHHSSYSSSHHHHRHHHRHRSPADLSLEEIRHLNDELAKYGIPVFSNHHHGSHDHRRPQSIGEILSACQLLSNNPVLAQYQHHPEAVRHVWDLVHNYQAPPPPPPVSFNSIGYPPPPPPAPPAGNTGGGVLAKLFGSSAGAPPPPAPYNPMGYPPPPPPMPYNPGPSMMPPPPPPPGPPSGGAGSGVLSRLFGS